VTPTRPDHGAKLAFTIREACSASGIGRTMLYAMIRSSRLEVRKAGRRTLIPAEALHRLLETLPRNA